MQRCLVMIEVALAVVLVVGSGLMLRTLDKLNSVDPGFRAEGVLVFRLSPSPARHRGGEGYHRFYDDVLKQVRAAPGVEAAGAIQMRPVTPSSWTNPIYPEGHVVPQDASPPQHEFRMATPGYFETLRIPLLAAGVQSRAPAVVPAGVRSLCGPRRASGPHHCRPRNAVGAVALG